MALQKRKRTPPTRTLRTRASRKRDSSETPETVLVPEILETPESNGCGQSIFDDSPISAFNVPDTPLSDLSDLSDVPSDLSEYEEAKASPFTKRVKKRVKYTTPTPSGKQAPQDFLISPGSHVEHTAQGDVYPTTEALAGILDQDIEGSLYTPSIPAPELGFAEADVAAHVESPSDSSTSHQFSPPPTPDPTFDNLEKLSRALVPPGGFISPKPEPLGQPEVWATGRQELCETLHYFRSYQGGAYTSGGFAWGFMFDKTAHPRDYTDSDVVISRAGGSMAKSKASGEMMLSSDQIEKSQTTSLRNSIMQYNPVVIIAGIDNPTLPSKPPHTYCVLDYFKPTHIWCEKSKGKTMIRYRFEKLNAAKQSWWQSKNAADPVALGSLPPPHGEDCLSCGRFSDQVYLQGWMCLYSTCSAYWKLDDDTEPHEDQLLYDPRFLKQKTTWHNETHTYSLKPSRVELSSHAAPGEDCSRAFWAGMVCPDCGRCIMRIAWLMWECPCGFTKSPPHTIIPAKSLGDPHFPLSTSYTLSRDLCFSIVGLEVLFKHNYRINKFTIPGIDGFVAHLIANKTINEEPGGPDDMFEELQTRDIGLRRRPLQNGMLKGETYTRNFLVNYGMPYKFIAATSSESFDGAANAITATRTRLNWVSKFMAATDKHLEFNEVLALGYFEQQKISYHDDGEFGLGPTIATISLGAPGTMKLRMKDRHYHGVSSQGIFNDDWPMLGCQKLDERRVAVEELLRLKAKAPIAAYKAHLKKISKELGLKSTGHAKDAITLALGHGDIVIMHGEGIQKYYEHAVEHSGKLRFALTCRYIDPNSLKEADKPKYEVARDLGVYDGSKLGEGDD